MNAEEFYRILDDFKDILKENDFKKQSHNTYIFNKVIEIKFILDKWGWSASDGWSFVIRVADKNSFGEYGLIDRHGEFDVNTHFIKKEKILTGADVKQIYGDGARFFENSWIVFRSSDELSKLLHRLLPKTLVYIKFWSTSRPTESLPGDGKQPHSTSADDLQIRNELEKLAGEGHSITSIDPKK